MAFIPVQVEEWLKRERNIYPTHHFTLAELGLMYPSALALRYFDNVDEETLFGDDYFILLRRGQIASSRQLNIWKFTETGRELLKLVSKPFDEEYYEVVGKFFVSRGADVAIAKVSRTRESGETDYDVIKQVTG